MVSISAPEMNSVLTKKICPVDCPMWHPKSPSRREDDPRILETSKVVPQVQFIIILQIIKIASESNILSFDQKNVALGIFTKIMFSFCVANSYSHFYKTVCIKILWKKKKTSVTKLQLLEYQKFICTDNVTAPINDTRMSVTGRSWTKCEHKQSTKYINLFIWQISGFSLLVSI